MAGMAVFLLGAIDRLTLTIDHSNSPHAARSGIGQESQQLAQEIHKHATGIRACSLQPLMR